LILRHTDLIGNDFTLFLTLTASTLFALVIGVAFHEFCHAFMANSLGDTLPARQGRVTLNPLAHFEPLGALMMLFVGFGWGKPVQFNPFGLKVSPKTATLLVAAAGPLSNFAAAFLLALPIKFGSVPYINPFGSVAGVNTSQEYLGLFLTGAVYLNVILGVFNFLPLPPLDGFNVAVAILPDNLSRSFSKLNQYGLGPLFLLLFAIPIVSVQLTGRAYSPLSDIMAPTVIRLLRFFTGVG
jgi:Zn-dependent protease